MPKQRERWIAAHQALGHDPHPALDGLEARVVDEVGNLVPTRGVGVIELRGEPLTPGYITVGVGPP